MPPKSLEAHISKWRSCEKCPLHKDRTETVIYRGACPCDVLFVGEAPGEAENICGEPFVGPAGKLLDRFINDLFPDESIGITNILCCIPWKTTADKLPAGVRPPERSEVVACRPRLKEIIHLAKPKIVFTLGKETDRYFPKVKDGLPDTLPVVNLIHPSGLLRMSKREPFRYSEEYARCVMKIHRAKEMFL